MAWTTPLTAVSNAALTAAQWNASVRDNLLETATAKATGAAGSYFAGTAPNALAERVIGQTFTSTIDTTVSSTFDDLAGGSGPSVTVTSGSRAVVSVSASVANNTVNALSAMGFEVSGATATAAVAAASLRFTSATANANLTGSYIAMAVLVAGSNTFTAKYSVSTGTGSFGSRRILVLPL